MNSELFQDLASQLLSEVFDFLEGQGVSPDDLIGLQSEAKDLSLLLLDPSVSEQEREAALRALKGIPIRVRQLVIAVKNEVADTARDIFDHLVNIVQSLVKMLFA